MVVWPDSRFGWMVPPCWFARKQLYASHYYEGAPELVTGVAAAGVGGAPGAYILTVRRFRFDKTFLAVCSTFAAAYGNNW